MTGDRTSGKFGAQMWRWLWMGALAGLLVSGCGGGDDDDGAGDADADTDADSDGDGDADADTDADADADTDADADADADGDADDGPDDDADGLPDRREQELAEAYFPFLSVVGDDACPESAVVFRAHPHPDDPAMVHILYDVLYDDDCGANGHPGDDEVFAIAIDPSVPAPAGILAMVAIAHQDTPCDNESRCQTCGPDGNTCSTAEVDGADWPVVFHSRNKHGGYLRDGIGLGHCDGGCFFADACDLAAASARPPMGNAGEPEHPLITDATAAGLVTPENGFEHEELLHYDPWGGTDFGEAGNVSLDLVDADFDVPLPEC